ncbi:zinc finger BED domain-containing protein RICESLEEPER 2-like [Camellia sinensis]|uniref:zinc finger BED domain-containing protein RICESLEEPER 2-like n=1 Tax=Camellia sinensis TaxID=4442 RepID=UPI0010368324|nr:zinc finger BED domain-containing protein RICESLEEPER 2-like [Camellia sinensis]
MVVVIEGLVVTVVEGGGCSDEEDETQRGVSEEICNRYFKQNFYIFKVKANILLLNIVGQSCKTISGTSTVWRHLKQCSYYDGNKDPTQQHLSFSSTVDSQSQIVNWKFDQEHCRRELACMIIIDELPFSFVEKEGFKRFVNALQPKFHIVSRTTITKDCIEIYNFERKLLKAIFQSSTSRVCLTIDLWTSIQNLRYMCLTTHYVDNDLKLQKKIINFRVLLSPHRGEVITQAVETCLLEWQLEKLGTLMVDNASSNDVAALSLKMKLVKRDGLLLNGDFFHVRCFAHILNLIVRDEIEEAKSSILALRDYVKYVRSSPSRLLSKNVPRRKEFWVRGLCV